MSKLNIKDSTWYALAGLFVAVAFLPILKASAPKYFRTVDGFCSGEC